MASVMASVTVEPMRRLRISPRWVDLAERVAVLAIFMSFAIRNYDAVVHEHRWFNLVMIASEGLVALFVMIRRPAQTLTAVPGEWALAFAATIGPMLVRASNGSAPLAPAGVGVVILLMGVTLQLAAKLTLRRSFGIVPANRGVKISGPYRYVRHPMYLGYVTVHIGFLVMSPDLLNLAIYAVSFAIQIVRLLAEEKLLSADPSYGVFQQQVRWRLVPGIF